MKNAIVGAVGCSAIYLGAWEKTRLPAPWTIGTRTSVLAVDPAVTMNPLQPVSVAVQEPLEDTAVDSQSTDKKTSVEV